MKKQAKVIRRRMWGVFFGKDLEAVFPNRIMADRFLTGNFYPDGVRPVIVEWKEKGK